jgi:hypothetical protein
MSRGGNTQGVNVRCFVMLSSLEHCGWVLITTAIFFSAAQGLRKYIQLHIKREMALATGAVSRVDSNVYNF